jgi:phage terminase large subunit
LVLAHGELWLDELIYNTGMTNPMIAERAKSLGLTRNDVIIADSAEPKSIRELNNLGLNVEACVKGADSIKNGIDILQRYTLNVTRDSTGLRREMLNYKWRVTKDGITTNEPVDCFNHAIDAVRYGALARLKIAQKPRGITVRQ